MGFQLKGVMDLLYPDFLAGKSITARRLSTKHAEYFQGRLKEYLHGRNATIRAICIEYLQSDCAKLSKDPQLKSVMKKIALILDEVHVG